MKIGFGNVNRLSTQRLKMINAVATTTGLAHFGHSETK